MASATEACPPLCRTVTTPGVRQMPSATGTLADTSKRILLPESEEEDVPSEEDPAKGDNLSPLGRQIMAARTAPEALGEVAKRQPKPPPGPFIPHIDTTAASLRARDAAIPTRFTLPGVAHRALGESLVATSSSISLRMAPDESPCCRLRLFSGRGALV